MAPPPKPPSPERLLFVDGLRGIAALAVVAFHSYAFFVPDRVAEFSGNLPRWLEWIPYHGWLGVEMFFVISGFVIAHSVRGRRVTPGFIGNFALRRSIRLDLPYWVVIAAELLLVSIGGLAWNGKAQAFDWGQVGSHLLYLQGILEKEQIVGVFWTLCIEIQLYLVFMILLGVAHRVVDWRGGPLRGGRLLAFLAVFAPLAVYSLVPLFRDESTLPWFTRFFSMFMLGALVNWCLEGLVPRWCFFLLAVPMAALLAGYWTPLAFVALATAGLLYLAGRREKLGTWLNVRPIQYLGRISYSLYLVHLVVGDRVLGWGIERTGMGPLSITGWIFAGLASSFMAAHLLHRFVEAPTLRFSRRFKPAPSSAPLGVGLPSPATPSPSACTHPSPAVSLAEGAAN